MRRNGARMNVKEAVKIAADYVADMEQLTLSHQSRAKQEEYQFLGQLNFSIEGTRFDEKSSEWIIEVGFTRPWDKAPANPLLGQAGIAQDRRTIKKVTISDSDGKVITYGD